MGLTKYSIGELIELVEETNSAGQFGPDDVRGMTITKEIIPTKADVSGSDLSKFLVVHPKEFVFNPRTHGKKIGFGYNDTDSSFIISWNNIAFRVKDEAKNKVLPEYLFLHFNREEWDREACFRSWGSSTEVFSWDALCEMKLTLPSISQQRKYVDVYLALQKNLAAYQSKVEELKMVCDGYIEELRRNMKCEKIGGYIRECNDRNDNLIVTEVQGVESAGNFTDTRANTVGLDFHNYKIVRPNQFAYNPSRINLGSIAMREESQGDCIVSPMYVVFEIVDPDKLTPEYLLLWLTRSEFYRSTLFYASGSVRDTFGFTDMKEVAIPIPDISVQREIVNIHRCYIERQRIAAQLKEQLNKLCPILIKGSLQN